MRAESRYLQTPGVRDDLPPFRHVTFTSTKVPRFAGTTSWEHFRQAFDAIVLSNGWNDATVALQLLFHLEGDAFNVAPRRASRVGLVNALTTHYGEKMSDGHSDAGAGEERETDSGDMTDDGEVELNLPREDAVERDPPGEDVRDLPGTTASGISFSRFC